MPLISSLVAVISNFRHHYILPHRLRSINFDYQTPQWMIDDGQKEDLRVQSFVALPFDYVGIIHSFTVNDAVHCLVK